MTRAALLSALSMAAAFAVDGATGDGATGLTYALGNLEESDISSAMMSAASENCFLETIRMDGVENCTTYIGIPMVCVRMRNNMAANLLEATGRRQHYSIQTMMSEVWLNAWANSQLAQPTNKKIGQDTSDVGGGSASGRVQGRTLGIPLITEGIMSLASGISFGTLCKPGTAVGGYFYFADGDETAAGSTWRSIISPYYLNGMTSGLSFMAKALETSSLCSLDLNFMLCYGGFGTKYPTAGDIGAGSPALRLITGAWRAQEIHSAPTLTYGPYDTSLGSSIHSQMHLSSSMVGSNSTNLPPYSPASYMQWLYPGSVGGSPQGDEDESCYVLGVGPGTAPIVATQSLSELINKTFSEEDTIAFAYWARWTCCNWCAASYDAAAKHALPEQGYYPVLTRDP